MNSVSNPHPHGPHQAISAGDERERFALELFDRLWDRYRQRVSYVRDYEKVVSDVGGTFVNDHIAFRTFACQRPPTGIASISRIFEALGYRAAGNYHFDDKHLGAIHYQHPNPEFPKLFISELKLWELSDTIRDTVVQTLQTHREPLADEMLAALARLKDGNTSDRDALMEAVVREIHELPWSPPDKAAVLALNEESQYAAWVLVHGYNVNHFTALINSRGVFALDNIEKTVSALQRAGVPMKPEIEGEPGSKLRQTATEAVMIDVSVREEGADTTLPWTYAYFELAERNDVTDPETGRTRRFEGFLGPQASSLFEMTRVKKS